MGTRINAGIQGRRLRNDRRLPGKHGALPLLLRHKGNARRRQRHTSAGARAEARDNETPHGRRRGSQNQVRLEVRTERQLLEKLDGNEQMYRFHRHYRAEKGLRTAPAPLAGHHGIPQGQARLRPHGEALRRAFRAHARILFLERDVPRHERTRYPRHKGRQRYGGKRLGKET